jgi:hypothetical protein
MIKHETLRSGSRSLDVLPGEAGVRQEYNPGTIAALDDQLTVHDGQPLI